MGSGWLGLPLTTHFLKLGYAVKTSTTTEEKLRQISSLGAEAYLVDISTIDQEVAQFLNSDTLIVNITGKNIEFFAHLVNKIKHSPVSQVIFISSTSVYKNNQSTVDESEQYLLESSPLLAIEKLFCAAQEFDTTVIRFAGLVGPGRHPGRFFRSGKLVKNPDTGVNLIHLDDCIEIISLVMKQQSWGQVYNGCSDTHPTKRAFYARAATLLGREQPVFDESSSNEFKLVANDKVKQQLNYQFKYPDMDAALATNAFNS